MRFGVLGPLAVWTSAGEQLTVPGLKVRALLADLLVHAGEPVSADRLVDDLWGERAPADPAGALQAKVSQLRRALAAEPGGRDLVEYRPPGYLLRAAGNMVDASQFQDLLNRAHAVGDPGPGPPSWPKPSACGGAARSLISVTSSSPRPRSVAWRRNGSSRWKSRPRRAWRWATTPSSPANSPAWCPGIRCENDSGPRS